MTASEFYSYLRERGVELWVDGDRLRYRAPREVLTPTLRAELAAHKLEIMALLEASSPAESQDAIPLRRVPREEALPLSFAQERFWFLDQLDPGSPAYNQPLALRVAGSLDVPALEHGLNEIVRRHEVMRAACSAVGGQPTLSISPEVDLKVPVVDLRELPQVEREATVLQLITEEARKPFDLSQSPMLRVIVYRLLDQEYVLLLSTHHFVADGWSFGIFFRELSALYQSYQDGTEAHLPEIPIQYADVAYWQRERMNGAVLEKESAYWKQRLAGAPPELDLPTDYPRPPVQTYRGAKWPFALPANLTAALKVLSREERVTLFMTLLAGLQTLLFRYTHQRDIVMGTNVSNRNRSEAEPLIGSFANSVVLRTDFSGNPTFRTLLRRVHETTIQDYAHQEFPFEVLVDVLQPERDMSRPPLFQVSLLLHQRGEDERLRLPGLSLVELPIELGTSRYDLFFDLVEQDGELVGSLEYSTDLFHPGTMDRLLQNFVILLQGIVANPEQRVSDLPLIAEAERRLLLVDWNDTQTPYPKDACIHHHFEAQVQHTPEATALVSGDQHLTYDQLNRRANQLAHHLQSWGVGPGSLVGIFLDRSRDLVVGLLAVLKAGGAYVPLDPSFPKERLAFIMQDARVPVLLSQQNLLPDLPEHQARTLCLDADWPTVSQQDQTNPVAGPSPSGLAYVIHTSGSTGQPKGVQIPHQAVVNFLHHMRRQPGLSRHDSLLAVTTISFDIAALELFLPLSAGARLVLADRETASDPIRLSATLAQSGATVMQATPATWRMLLESGWQGDAQLRILCGGEALPRTLTDQLLPKCAELWNLYGPTETTIWSTVKQIQGGDGPIPIGRPIANTQIYLLDTYLQPVPIGVFGQLYIAGDGLAQGYLRRPALTAEKFIPNPFSTLPGSRLYHTGDLARYLPDGDIEFFGRTDHQVKVRGFRIELGEIEAILAQHPAVRETVALVREDTPGDRRLVAYLVPHQEPPSGSGLRHFLQQKLPDYMIPSAYVMLDALPLTPNGKVNRRALPPPDWSSPELERAFVAPRTTIEEVVASIWSQVLGVEQIGVHDSFFELGGHSLLATQATARLRQALEVNLALRDLFETPTVASLADSIQAQHKLIRNEGMTPEGSSSRREEGEI